MSARSFFDTNILIYAFASGDARQDLALSLLASGGTISVQVLNEFAAVSQRKLGLSWDEINKRVETIKQLVDTPAPITEQLHDEARKLARSRKMPFYDALILASALGEKCSTLWSEDFQHGSKVGTLTIRNPFLG